MKNLSFIIISIVLFFASCVEDITLPLQGGTKMLVVEGGITTDTLQHRIMLSLTNDFYEAQKPQPVSGATITISDGENTYLLAEDTIAGSYLTPAFAAEVNKNYRLDISNIDIDGDGNFENYWAETSVPYKMPKLDSVAVKDHFRREGYLNMYIFMKDNGSEENYYMGKIAVDDVLQNDTISRYFCMNDVYFNGLYIYGGFPVYSFKKEADGKPDDYRVLPPNSKVTAYAYSISKDYYNFLIEVRNSGSANPFMGPPAPPRTNIQPAGKACGFFYVASVSQRSVTYLPKPDEPVMGK